MAHQLSTDLLAAIESHVRGCSGEPLANISCAIKKELRRLAESGLLPLGHDKDLTGESLEIRVFLLLREMGIQAVRGRPGFEDFVANPPAGATPNLPLVIEVKSDRKPSVQRGDLRQLDDWVFDLSGEEVARKKGLGGTISPYAIATLGLHTETYHHPSPHKGLLIVNAPVGVPFDQRTSSLLSPDELEFAQRRNFCIVAIDELVAEAEAVRHKRKSLLETWMAIHNTCGMYVSSKRQPQR